MIKLGFTLSSEEFGPRDLVRFAIRAEEAGFGYAVIPDHFHPWIDERAIAHSFSHRVAARGRRL